MRTLRRLAWAAAVAAATASPAAAQTGGGGGGAASGGNLGNFQTNAPAATTTLNTAGTTSGTTGPAGSTANAAEFPQLAAVEKAPQINPPSTFSNNGKVAASNFLGPTYVELRSLGLLDKSRSAAAPAGLGNVVFAATGAGAGGAAGARGTTTATGRTGGTGTGQTTDPGGQLVQLPRQIAYTAQLKFAVPPLPAPRLQADLRGVIDRAGLAASPAGVQVLVDGNAVVLRGAVADGDEARLVEGLVRLTPGVGRITNELTYARP